MTTIEQARKVKQYLVSINEKMSATIGISRDNSGYYVKVHLFEPTTHNIPSSVDNVKVEVEIVGTPEIY